MFTWSIQWTHSPASPSDKSTGGDEQPLGQDIKLAKEVYANQIATIESDAARLIDDAMRAACIKADELKRERSKAAREKLLDAYDQAIERAMKASDLTAASTLTSEKQSLEGLGLPLADFNPEQLDDGALYRCVLGKYGQFGGRPHPVVNLSVPNKDVWSEKIQAKLRGRIDFHEINYRGEATLIVGSDGVCNFDFPFHTQVHLNGKALSAGSAALKKGAYAVTIEVGTHGGTYILESYIRVMLGDQEIPLVNSGADIKRFLAQHVDGRPVVEVSGCHPEVADIFSPGQLEVK
jgi:hypothetical protein